MITALSPIQGDYISVFFYHVSALGSRVVVEGGRSQGRAEMAVKFNSKIYLFEFRIIEDKADSKALKQTRATSYAKSIKLNLCINWSGIFEKRRLIVDYKAEAAGGINKEKYRLLACRKCCAIRCVFFASG